MRKLSGSFMFSAWLVLAGPARALDLEAARLLDLTHAFDQQTIYWPTARPFHLEPG
jgi:hypothetical protein